MTSPRSPSRAEPSSFGSKPSPFSTASCCWPAVNKTVAGNSKEPELGTHFELGKRGLKNSTGPLQGVAPRPSSPVPGGLRFSDRLTLSREAEQPRAPSRPPSPADRDRPDVPCLGGEATRVGPVQQATCPPKNRPDHPALGGPHGDTGKAAPPAEERDHTRRRLDLGLAAWDPGTQGSLGLAAQSVTFWFQTRPSAAGFHRPCVLQVSVQLSPGGFPMAQPPSLPPRPPSFCGTLGSVDVPGLPVSAAWRRPARLFVCLSVVCFALAGWEVPGTDPCSQ